MLALIYLALAIYLGDHICRRFYRFVSVAHRWAAGFLVGVLFSSWFTYLTALAFARASKPLLWADIIFFAVGAGMVSLLYRQWRHGRRRDPVWVEPRAPRSEKWDWVVLAIYFAFACWMMFATFNFKSPNLQIANHEFSDFGPNTAIARSFSVGHNFPTQYPHFPGSPIRYHFLFYFLAGNLEFLGLNLAWSINLLSILSLVCMLALIMALAQLLFQLRSVGRIASALFFFHGTLSFIEFFRTQKSFSGAFHSILNLKDFLASGYPYRGELWGIWTQIVFINQRHLASGIGIFLLVLIFLFDQYRRRRRPAQVDVVSTADNVSTDSPPPPPSVPPDQPKVDFRTKAIELTKNFIVSNKGFIFSGFLLGALPFWNAFVFTSAAVVLFFLFILFPYRGSMMALAVTAGVTAFPQVHFLEAGAAKSTTPRLFHWGYVIDNPTIAKVVAYLGWTFGVKWLLIALALIFVSWFHRRLFLAISSLFLLTFFFQFSIEMLANHKFLTLWLIIANIFVAYGLWLLWHTKIKGLVIAARATALVLAAMIVIGGVIDFFPIHNSYYVELNYTKDPLVDWVRTHTDPHDIFLSDRFVSHQILLAGRRIFYGWPSFAWGSGYDTTKRDEVYRQLFESKDPRVVYRLLQENNIRWVAIDEGVRHGEFIRRPNEEVYSANFKKVFEDTANKYAGLRIYEVPKSAPEHFTYTETAGPSVPPVESPPVTVFQGGKGTGRGQFDFPRGLALDRLGNIFVSDTNNGRIEKFSSSGTYLGTIARMGRAEGELKEPNGIAIDKFGNIYVADVGNQRVQKLNWGGRFLAQWSGPPPGFYGPRDIYIAADDSIYVVDQGRARIAKFSPAGDILAVWGSSGTGDGQFSDPTSVAVDDKSNRVYVADPRNKRIQVFDGNGNFMTKWAVPEWQPAGWALQDLVIDSKTGRLYASSVSTDEVLVFDLAGKKLGGLKPKAPDKLEGASALALFDGKLYVLNSFANRVSRIDLPGQ